eukprot:gnl/TRDRNA2_/TRDRNA2_165550_c0_seq2.p1 gnl/TRDRNA2_/TRDRNA2_165550_c0~~gnl/TRDRNA2_/TRDRNA2_165550_c0_seq2.p1  ORF type:complete len:530 (-),score=109.41 gnl/TRDRNA2_/TRDRNA2_165550_c0_seq2:22-1611(-)
MAGDGSSLLTLLFGVCSCIKAFDCQERIDSYGGIVLWFAVMLYMFKALGTICDEYFVPSLEVIVEKLQLSNDVAGATFMAAGSSAPELFANMVATFLIVNEGGIGTIIGSAIFNILVIVGITGYVACKDQSLQIWWYPLTRDCTFYVIAIIELTVFLEDEQIHWHESFIMFMTYVGYCIYMKYNEKILSLLGINKLTDVEDAEDGDGTVEIGKGDQLREGADGEDAPGPPEHHLGFTGPENEKTALPPEVEAPEGDKEGNNPTTATEEDSGEVTFVQKVNSLNSKASGRSGGQQGHRVSMSYKRNSVQSDPIGKIEGQAEMDPKEELEEKKGLTLDPLSLLWMHTMPSAEHRCWLLFSLSIFFIGVCTWLMVDATVRIGCNLQIDELVMGLIFIAAGTSIPDALGSVAVAKQGEGDMAIANALGSNVFDILLGLGLPWTIRCWMGGKVCFPGAAQQLTENIIILVIVLVVFVSALALNRWRLNRYVGGALICFYLVYVLYALIPALVNPEQRGAGRRLEGAPEWLHGGL